MSDTVSDRAIADRLLKLNEQIEFADFFPTLEPEASHFALTDPFAFLVAAVIDRGNSKINWTVPYWLKQRWGHLSPTRINAMGSVDIEEAFRGGPRGLDRDRSLLSGIFWRRVLEREGAEDDPEKAT
ncbi:hypothetical protein H0Z60_19630 [Ectothiorhodospiraceae bacterium WFHF3C12]|nr:hypothetical protein [Ectothiorhodospiraceae bacterium WFHF3C12]